jgi:hypothetical protein
MGGGPVNSEKLVEIEIHQVCESIQWSRDVIEIEDKRNEATTRKMERMNSKDLGRRGLVYDAGAANPTGSR